MVFSSYIFILLFLPAVLVIYYALSHLKNGIYQRVFLIIASLFFYGYYNVKYLLLIISSIVVNYIIASLIQNTQETKSKCCFAIGILFNVCLLGYFKYYDFFIENINFVFKTSFALKHILLPLGISFFTFQQLSFLVSVYHREEKVERLRDYCLFVTFFPQLVAGPIVLYSEMIPQFKSESRRYFNADCFSSGIFMFSLGLFKKTVIADTLAFFADAGFGMSGLGLAAGWITSICYTLQIFFDFSGYSDMAIGLGRLFNIDIPVNFQKPYLSESITEFWRRWHITLGRALSTYVYKPLGGNRKGLFRTCVNLFITFLVSGLWHGAAWTFIIWGALHGAFVVFERITMDKLSKIPKQIRIVITFLIVNSLWVLFRADGFGQAIEIYKSFVNFNYLGGLWDLVIKTGSMVCSVINVVVLAISFIVLPLLKLPTKAEDFSPSAKSVVLSSIFFCLSFLCLSRESIFIYFNF